ncbi:MAG: RNA 2'-phosphotransferase [Pirellulaceae bacterium]
MSQTSRQETSCTNTWSRQRAARADFEWCGATPRCGGHNDKKRFALSDDGLRIRANQGHSVRHVDLDLPAVQPPTDLYHRTVAQFLASIRAQGLLKRSRNHVHLSADRETAMKVGIRRGEPVVLTVAAGDMHAAGYRFYLSQNGVWLTDAVPAEFLTLP